METLAVISGYCRALKAKVTHALHHYEEWKTEHQHLGRYSIEKLVAFHEYQKSVSQVRVVLVLVLGPLPTVLVLCGLDLIPLKDPRRPVSEHYGTFLRSALSHTMLTYSFLMAVKQALSLSNNAYSHRLILLISVLGGIGQEAVWVSIAFGWRFPVPFRELMGVCPWATFCIIFNVIFARKVFAKCLQKLKQYLPIVGTQLVLFYLFLALSLGFAYVPTGVQVVMILVFPLVKVAIKRFLWRYAQKLDDMSTDVTICMVEISGSLYQTVCMQFVNPQFLGSLMMVMDFVQAALEIKAYLGHDYITDGKSTLQTAVKIVESATIPAADGTAHSPPPSQPKNRFELGLGSRQSSLENRLTADSSAGGAYDSSPTQTVSSWWMRALWGPSGRYAASPRASIDKRLPQSQSQSQSSSHSVALQRKMLHKHKSRQLLDLRKISPDISADLIGQALNSDLDPQSPGSEPATARNTTTMGFHVDNQSEVDAHAADSASVAAPASQDHAQPSTSDSHMPGKAICIAKRQTESHTSTSAPVRLLRVPSIGKRRSSYARVLIDGVVIQRRDQARILEQTLQLLFACEVLIFVEYMEVFMPVLYGACIGSLWHLPNAKYSMLLMSMSEASMASNVVSSFAYAAAETLSFASMYWVIKNKYGISVLYLLAFVLETYWMTLQGKLIGCFITIVNSATLHQGIDFSFRFDYNAILK
ncbi:hypothetical protein Gpo141_00014092 [Globisporangium polare]